MFNNFKSQISKIFSSHRIDDASLEKFEDLLIMSDIDLETSSFIISKLKNEKFIENPSIEKIQSSLEEIIKNILSKNKKNIDYSINKSPYVILMTGVNGSGKTTTIAKLANQFKENNKNVLMVAADTFRAAATEQLSEWSSRIGTDIIKDVDGSDPASIVFKSIEHAKRNGNDVIIIDTAGRLQNKQDLMDQLGKIDRVLKKHDDSFPHESIIVIDATTGQNALKQIEEFNKYTPITGVILTKFDSNAAGGTVVSLSNSTDIPVLAIGSGESINDIESFDPDKFSKSLVNS